MSLNLNPWLALLLGILIGWVLEWLLELWFFRRRRLECQRRLADVEARLRTRDEELRREKIKTGSLEDRLAASLAVAPAVTAAVEMAAPVAEIGIPQREVAWPTAELEAPAVEVVVPEAAIELPELAVEAPQIGQRDITAEVEPVAGVAVAVVAPEVTPETGELQAELLEAQLEAALPEAELPAVSLEAPYVRAVLPQEELKATELAAGLPEVELEAPAIAAELPALELGVPGVAAPIAGPAAVALGAAAGEKPAVDAELPEVEIAVPEIKAELPEVEIEAPEVKAELPEVEIAAPAVKAELPEVEIAAPEVKAELLEVEIEAPEVKAELPEVEIAAPAVKAELPEVEIEAPAVKAGLPEVEIEAPEVKAGLPAIEIEAPPIAPGPATNGNAQDDLTLIRGIGPKFAVQLAAAGITSFAALAAATPEQLRDAAKAPTWQQVDYDAWIAEAKDLAGRPRSAGDDLLIIEGIGPVYAAKLQAAGITTFAQLAAADNARLTEIIQAPAWRKVDYDAWREQARLAAAGDEASLQVLQDKLYARAGQGDDLALINGVGDKTAAALKAAGITSFAALAAATPEQLDEITKKAGLHTGDYAAWIAQAGQFAGKRSQGITDLVACPQDLAKVKGIGSVYETKLYEAGIGAFSELANTDEAELRRIFVLMEFQKIDLAAIKADAQRLAEETQTVGRGWTGTPPDDFEPLTEIGPTYEGRLYDAGICTYQALANATVEQLAEICKAPAWRMPDYANWIAQAKELLAQQGR